MGGYGNSLERMSTGSFSYMPDAEAYKNIGYEGNQCRYVPGTAEQLVDEYLGMLESMHGK